VPPTLLNIVSSVPEGAGSTAYAMLEGYWSPTLRLAPNHAFLLVTAGGNVYVARFVLHRAGILDWEIALNWAALERAAADVVDEHARARWGAGQYHCPVQLMHQAIFLTEPARHAP
jgi:hypothetical protein